MDRGGLSESAEGLRVGKTERGYEPGRRVRRGLRSEDLRKAEERRTLGSTAAAPTYTLEHGHGCRYFTVTFAITRYRIANCGHVFAHWRKNGY